MRQCLSETPSVKVSIRRAKELEYDCMLRNDTSAYAFFCIGPLSIIGQWCVCSQGMMMVVLGGRQGEEEEEVREPLNHVRFLGPLALVFGLLYTYITLIPSHHSTKTLLCSGIFTRYIMCHKSSKLHSNSRTRSIARLVLRGNKMNYDINGEGCIMSFVYSERGEEITSRVVSRIYISSRRPLYSEELGPCI